MTIGEIILITDLRRRWDLVGVSRVRAGLVLGGGGAGGGLGGAGVREVKRVTPYLNKQWWIWVSG